MEEIKLEGSPAQLLAAEDADDDEPVSIHEPPEGDDVDEGDEQTPATPEELTPEQREERRQLIRKIGRYRAIFGKELSDVKTTGLDSMPLASLKDLATDCEFLVGCRRSSKAIRGLFLGGLQGLELCGPMVGFKLAGLANVASQSQDLLETVDEVAIAHEKALYVDPVARLALSVMQLAVAVDAHNRQKEATVVAVAPAATQASYEGPKPAPSQRPDNISAAKEYEDL